MKKHEAIATTKCQGWIRKTLPTCGWEIKHTRGSTSFRVSELKEHQINWLLATTTHDGAIWKIPDAGYGYNPFDGFLLKDVNGFLIIIYPTWTVAIEIKLFLLKAKKPSISEEEALKIAWFKILTKDT